jgi:hypothetical protein
MYTPAMSILYAWPMSGPSPWPIITAMNETVSPVPDAPAATPRTRRFMLLSEPAPPQGTAGVGGVRVRRYRLASLGAVRRVNVGPSARMPRDFAHLARSYD